MITKGSVILSLALIFRNDILTAVEFVYLQFKDQRMVNKVFAILLIALTALAHYLNNNCLSVRTI
jgi:hypothetical protein